MHLKIFVVANVHQPPEQSQVNTSSGAMPQVSFQGSPDLELGDDLAAHGAAQLGSEQTSAPKRAPYNLKAGHKSRCYSAETIAIVCALLVCILLASSTRATYSSCRRCTDGSG